MRVLDLGSGAGFPSLILAAACAADFTLLEARRKRASFLTVAAAEMGLANVRVEPSRTDSMTLEPVFDVVTARAFAEPAIVYRTAAADAETVAEPLYAVLRDRHSEAARHFEPPGFSRWRGYCGATSVAPLIAVSKRR